MKKIALKVIGEVRHVVVFAATIVFLFFAFIILRLMGIKSLD